MTENSFRTGIEIAAPPADVFAGVRDVRGWWSQTLTGDSAELGDEFTYRDQGIRYATMRLTRVAPDTVMEWTVLDSYLNFVDDHEEWNGTTMTFELSPAGGSGRSDTGTRLVFTHHGLHPQVECFDACSTGWGRCMVSLQQLVATGTGTPDPQD